MSSIAPLRGVRYDPARTGGLEKVVAPPYDVISAERQEQLYQSSPNNVVRIDFGKEFPTDSPADNRYTRAGKLYREWKEQGVLVRDEKPTFYVYCQDFEVRGERFSRLGFLGLVKLEDFGGAIHPHEHTLSGPKQDRLNLMRACGAALSPVFSLYPGEGQGSARVRKAIAGMEPWADFVDSDGIRNRVWRVDDPGAIREITEFIEGVDLFIADGHHRYETALNYRNERRAANPDHTGNEPYNYVLMMLVDMGDPGLTVLPTHRLVRRPEGIDAQAIVRALEPGCEITPQPDLGSMIEALARFEGRAMAFALYAKSTGYRVVVLRDKAMFDAALPEGHAEAWRNLDVNLLHFLVLGKLLGIGQERWEDASLIAFTRDEKEAVRRVDSGEFEVAFFLNSTSVEQVRAVSAAGERMPQKSTFFYPKVLTGLVFNDFSSR